QFNYLAECRLVPGIYNGEESRQRQLYIEGENVNPNEENIEGHTNVPEPIMHANHAADTLRAFTNPECPHHSRLGPLTPGNADMDIERDTVRVWTDGSCHNNGMANAACGSGLWYGEDNVENKALKIPDSLPQSNNVGEITAALVAIQTHRGHTLGHTDLLISSDSTYTIDAMTTRICTWFSQGFVATRNQALVRSITGELLKTNAHICVRKVKGHSGERGNEEADRLANEGARKETDDDIDLTAGETVRRMGAELRALSQALAYWSVREVKKAPPRRRTMVMVEKTLAAVEDVTGDSNTSRALWKSIHQRKEAATSQKFSAWAWKSLHAGYKIGPYWRHILPERMNCNTCLEEPVEDMEHILCHCNSSGQEIIWELAKQLWSITGLPWPQISLGLILGINLVNVKNPEGKILNGRTRLLRVLISESSYLAWVIRCEWRIGRQADLSKLHTRREITARWSSIISKRIRMDWNLTNKRAYGSQAIRRGLIEKTWDGVQASEHAAHPTVTLATGVFSG
ncbi:RnaseH-domain-containing protein, partial [Coprinellus micaceus]